MSEEGLPLKNVINEALREGLRVLESNKKPRAKFVVQPHDFGLRPGIDPEKISQFDEELDDAMIMARFREPAPKE